MKKIMTFAILAFLVGGFSMNANAENKKQVNWDQKITEFEQAVNKCVEFYTQMQADEALAKEGMPKYKEALSDAITKRDYLNENRNQLSKKQGARFDAACRSLKKVMMPMATTEK